MRKILLAAACAATAMTGLLLAPTPSEARDYPVCSYGNGSGRGGAGGIMRCEFENYAQCRATTSGVGGSCMDNPILGARAQQWDGQWDQPQRPARRQRMN